ncbi:MAG TPA: iron ABC transporter permease [Microbacteriaceae bacterium]|jgi:iron(III) transport system permease protein|nr:iron ABC transporter permease [Microbacteriaceae bacterium]
MTSRADRPPLASPQLVRRRLGGRLLGGRGRTSPFDAITIVIALILIGIVIVPLARVLIGLFFVDGRFTIAPIVKTFALPDLGALILNTVIVAGCSSVAAVIIGTAFAWLNERTNVRMGLFADALPLLPLLLPPVAGAVGWTMLLSPRAGLLNAWFRDFVGLFGIDLGGTGPLDINSWYGLIMVYTFYAVPFVYMNVSASFRNFDASLEEASRLSGAGAFRTLRRVVVPAVIPGIGAGFLLCVWLGFGMFSVPSIIGTPAGIDVLSVRIVHLLTFSYPPHTDVAVGLSGIVVVFVGLAYVLQVRILRKGRYATMKGKGARSKLTDVGLWKWPLRAVELFYVLISTVLPIFALVIVALNGFWTPKIRWGNLSLQALQTSVLDDSITRQSLFNSLGLAIVGGLVGILIAAMVAIYVSRRHTKFARALDAGIKLPTAVSIMVLAVGILLFLAAPPFNLSGTLLILLIGYVAIFIPQASVAADSAVSSVGAELPEASAVTGAGSFRTFRMIQLPLIIPGLIVGWVMLFVRILGDLEVAAILSGTGNPVLGFRILDVFNGGSFALLASLSTVIVAISAIVVILALAYGRRKSRFGSSMNVG